MRRIAVINQKGGVGKTTTVANLAAALAAHGRRVLAIDLDPQAHLTLHFGVEPGEDRPGGFELLVESHGIEEVRTEVRPNVWLIPGSIDLAAAEQQLVSVVGREVVLRDALAGPNEEYDTLLIDCPPSLGLLTINALAAVDEVFVPLQPHFLALQGVGKLLETVALVRRRINPRLCVSGVVLCLYESGTRLTAEVVADIRGFLAQSSGSDLPWSGAKVFRTPIRRNVKLAECPSHGETIFEYAPRSNGARDYANLAAEILGLAGDGELKEPAESAVAGPAVTGDPPEPSTTSERESACVPTSEDEPRAPVAAVAVEASNTAPQPTAAPVVESAASSDTAGPGEAAPIDPETAAGARSGDQPEAMSRRDESETPHADDEAAPAVPPTTLSIQPLSNVG